MNGSYYNMLGVRRDVFYDMDGSATNGVFDSTTRTSATITNNWAHLLEDAGCTTPTTIDKWGGTIACDQTVPIRQVLFNNLIKLLEFKGISIKAKLLNDISTLLDENVTEYSESFSIMGNK